MHHKKWTVIWQEADGEGREVEVDSQKLADKLAAEVKERGWKPKVHKPHVPLAPVEAVEEPEADEPKPVEEKATKPKRKKR